LNAHPDWLSIIRHDTPLILSIPHTGTELPARFADGLVSPWLARRDADWWVQDLYGFAASAGATIVRTAISRTVIDVNRDPSGVSLYPGQATTELCPTTTFDGEPLYRPGAEPDAAQIAVRRAQFHAPYHAALSGEIARLRARHPVIVLYDCHSIRSRIPRLFEGELPQFNIGTNGGASCSPQLTASVEAVCGGTGHSWITNGRFKGGYITRHYGCPRDGVHAIQMELACRGYLREPEGPVGPESWPVPYEEAHAAPLRAVLVRILDACRSFAVTSAGSRL
jgi:N-formylglutamate deformylase